MAGEHRSLIEQIQAFLSVPNRPVDEKIQEAARSFARLVADSNARLERCRVLLAHNLRSAAIDVAEAQPSLFELVPEISFDEMEQWEVRTIESQGTEAPLETPPRILTLIFEDLDDAYAAELTVRPLMKKHRRLVLQHAPLTQRIQLMREVVELDSDRSWREDLEEYETARLAEIEKEAQAAARDGDATTLNRLFKELRESAWAVGEPKQLIRKVERVAKKVRQKVQVEGQASQDAEVLEQLKSIADQVDQDGQSMEDEELIELRQRWLRLEGQLHAKSTEVEHLNNSLNALWEYLDEEIAEQQADALKNQKRSELESAISSPHEHSVQLLKRYRDDAVAAGVEIDTELEDGFRRACRAIANRRRTKVLAIGGGLSACVLLLVGVAWMLVSSSAAQKELEQAAGRISSLVEEEDHERARAELQAFAQNYPAYANEDPLPDLEQQIRALEHAEEDRVEAFAETVAAVERHIARGSDPGRMLEMLDELQQTRSEQATINRLKTEFDVVQEQQLQQAATQASQQLSKATTLLDEVRRAIAASDVAQSLSLVNTAANLLAEVPRLNELPEPVQKQHETLMDRLSTVQGQVRQEEKRMAALNTVRRQADGVIATWTPSAVDDYTRAIETYRGLDATERLKITARDRYWKALIGWNSAVINWSSTGVLPAKTQEANGRLQLLRAVTTQTTGARSQLQTLLTEIAGRELNGGFSSHRTRITDVLKRPWLLGSWQLKGPQKPGTTDISGNVETYGPLAEFRISSVHKDPVELRDGFFRFSVLKSCREEVAMSVPLGDWKPTPTETKASILARKCISRIDEVEDTFDYERAVIEVIRMLAAAEKVRPELRSVIIYEIIEEAGKGSGLLKRRTEQLLQTAYRNTEREKIGGEPSTIAGWVRRWQPGRWLHHGADPAAEWIEPFLQNVLPELDGILPDVLTEIDDVAEKIMQTVRPVGYVWIRPDSSGNAIRLVGSTPSVADVYVLSQRGGLVGIGQLQNGEVRCNPADRDRLAIGQLIFVQEPVEFDNRWIGEQLGLLGTAPVPRPQ